MVCWLHATHPPSWCDTSTTCFTRPRQTCLQLAEPAAVLQSPLLLCPSSTHGSGASTSMCLVTLPA